MSQSRDSLSVNKQKVVSRRLATINKYQPDFVVTGLAGFGGCVIFGFSDRDLFLCESIHIGNATYVFGDDWKALSQMTKAEILIGALQKDRIIHREGWPLKVATLLK